MVIVIIKAINENPDYKIDTAIWGIYSCTEISVKEEPISEPSI